MDVESLVGESLPDGVFVAERWMTFLWANATQNDADTYRYPDAIDGSDTATPLIPPTFGATLAIDSAGGIDSMLEMIDIPEEKDIFHGEQHMKIICPLRVGVTYDVTAEITAVESKEVKQDEFHIITIEYLVLTDDEVAMELEIGAVVR